MPRLVVNLAKVMTDPLKPVRPRDRNGLGRNVISRDSAVIGGSKSSKADGPA
jgi:hypothetical protein